MEVSLVESDLGLTNPSLRFKQFRTEEHVIIIKQRDVIINKQTNKHLDILP